MFIFYVEANSQGYNHIQKIVHSLLNEYGVSSGGMKYSQIDCGYGCTTL